MPAITVEDTLVLPRIPRPDPAASVPRPVAKVITAHSQAEGAGFVVRRPFPGELSLTEADPFLLLDHVGPAGQRSGRGEGAPWHPHRGFETVSYILDGEIAHHDTNGGGGVIGEGDTQWMTAGGGILHDELPTERMYRTGGPFHAIQLWVNLPARAQDDATALPIDHSRRAAAAHLRRRRRAHPSHRRRHRGLRRTRRHAHADHLRPRDPGPRRRALRPVESAFSAMAYVMTGRGTAGPRAGRSRAANSWCSVRRPSRGRGGRPPGRAARRAPARGACRSARRSLTTDRS